MRYGRTWNRWVRSVVTRDILESVIAAAEGKTLHFIDTAAVVSGFKLRPDSDGNYDLGQISWCFVETTSGADSVDYCG